MSKNITLSLQNLNGLYFKFLGQFLSQHLSNNLKSQLTTLLSLKSPLDVYRYLEAIVNQSEQKKQAEKIVQNAVQKSNVSYQGSSSYVSKDDFKFAFQQNQSNTKKNTTLKRTNTYLAADQTSHKFLEDLKSLNLNKNDQSANLKQNNHLTNNIVKHDFDTFSEKHNLSMMKRQSKDSSQQAVNGHQFKAKIDSEAESSNKYVSLAKQRTDDVYSNTGYKKIQFAKTYSIRENEKANIQSGSLTSNISPSNGASWSRLQGIIRQANQVFKENQKKIEQYQKISANSLVRGQKAQQNYSYGNQNSANDFNYMYKKY